jgi:outer membrane protein
MTFLLLMVNFLRPSLFMKLLCVCLSACAIFAHAQMDEAVQKAQTLNVQGQWLEAFKLLDPSEVQRAGDPAFDLQMGIAANGAAQYMRAILALERVIAAQPSNALAHAELGRALFAVGDTVGARTHLSESKRLGASGQLVVAVDSILQSIDRAESEYKSSVRGYFEVSLGRDTNANSGPANSNVPVPAFGGLVFVLDSSGVKTESGFGNITGGILGRYVIDPRWSLTGNVHATMRRYNISASQFDTDRQSLLAGANYREERNELTLALTLDVAQLNQALSRRQSGIVGQWTHRLDQYQQLSTYLQGYRLRHPDAQSARDGTRLTMGADYAYTFRNDLIVYGGIYGGTERVLRDDLPHLGHRFLGLRMGAQKPITESVSAFGSLSYENRLFGAPETSFLVVRKDNQVNLGFGMHWVPEPFWRVTPQVSLVKTQSDIVINEFDKRVISITARREF